MSGGKITVTVKIYQQPLRKMRYGYGNRGKSHCAQVCYVDFEIHEKIFLVMVFAKNEMENLSQAERNSIKQLIERLEKYFEGSK